MYAPITVLVIVLSQVLGERYYDYRRGRILTYGNGDYYYVDEPSNRLGSSYSQSVCAQCGTNSQCNIVSGRPVCSCLPGHMGDPLTFCRKLECTESSDCASHQSCSNNHCVNPCVGLCGPGADCSVRNHVAVCSCPEHYTGNPFTGCRLLTRDELCYPNPCGVNTDCDVENYSPVCRCKPGYFGSPLSGCRHECESNQDCGPQQTCSNYRCKNACDQCGQRAECKIVQNHVATCVCPQNYIGDPYKSCQPECSHHTECPRHKPACYNFKCTDPCEGACGVGAKCELRNGITPVCFCPKDMTGNPFISCRPFQPADLCEPNPCGTNAKCTPGHDNTNKERPVCTCPAGYIGNALVSCHRGECQDDGDCADHQACVSYSCQNPCAGHICGTNAECTPRRHIAVCTCLSGYNGDALTSCHQSKTYPVARYLRFKKEIKEESVDEKEVKADEKKKTKSDDIKAIKADEKNETKSNDIKTEIGKKKVVSNEKKQ